jgi:hypothetical protein
MCRHAMCYTHHALPYGLVPALPVRGRNTTYSRECKWGCTCTLGVGKSTAALQAAGNGLLTKAVGAAAKFVLRSTS